MKPRFKVGDQWVNGLGQSVDEQGEVITPDTQPAPADAAAGQELLQANEILKADLDKANAELDELKSQLKTLTTARDGAPQELKDAQRQILAQSNEVADLKLKVDETGMALKAARAELETAQREGNEAQAHAETLKQQLDDLGILAQEVSGQRDALAEQLQTAQSAVRLPDDAKDRLVKVNGIGGKLADEAIAALTAK